MNNLGIEFISVFGMPPVQFIELAADLECPNISLGLTQMDYNPHGYPRYVLAEDVVLRREVKSALAANGVTVALGENVPVMPEGNSHDSWKATLDVLSEFGVKQVNSVSFASDFARNVDQYGALSELASSYGIRPLIEFVPIFGIPDLPTTLKVIEQVRHPALGFIFDTMHAGRTGVTTADIEAIPADRLGYIQLCDAPQGAASYALMDAGYMDEAVHERMVPGEGAMPLLDYLNVLPNDRIISLEVPLRKQAEAGVGPRERLQSCIKATKDLLAQIQ